MADVYGVGTQVVMALPTLPNLLCPQAGEIVTSVRDLFPDPLYDSVSGDPLPDADGFFRASTLYRWLTNGIRELTRRINWLVEDWTALPQTPRQQIVGLDRRFINVDGVFCNQYRLLHLDELQTIYPSFASAQPLWFSWHTRTDQLELSLWPAPDRQDPTVHLMTSLQPGALEIPLSSTAGFLPFGWARVQDELIQYSALSPALDPTAQPGLRVTRRGVGGTSAVLHYAGEPVEHLSIWVKGRRVPSAVTRSTDCVEVPMAFQAPLETYLLARCKLAEQDIGGSRALMQEFGEAVNSIVTDPVWQSAPYPSQVRPYGTPAAGEGLLWGRVVVP